MLDQDSDQDSDQGAAYEYEVQKVLDKKIENQQVYKNKHIFFF